MNRIIAYTLALWSLFFFHSTFVYSGVPTTSGPKTQVMIIGSHYLPHDVLRNNRQKEAHALVENIANFSPNKIVMDVPFQSSWEIKLNQDYRNYLSGQHVLNRSVREQIGFRLGEYLDIQKFYGIDTDAGFNLGELIYSASESGYSDQVKEFVSLGRGIETAKQHHMNTESPVSVFFIPKST